METAQAFEDGSSHFSWFTFPWQLTNRKAEKLELPTMSLLNNKEIES
jgi:hypothetical protein